MCHSGLEFNVDVTLYSGGNIAPTALPGCTFSVEGNLCVWGKLHAPRCNVCGMRWSIMIYHLDVRDLLGGCCRVV